MRIDAKQMDLLRTLLCYGIVGVIASGTDAFLFYYLHYRFGAEPLAANACSVPVGILISFLLNRAITFRVTDHPLRRGLIFFGVGFCGLLLSQLILAVGGWLGIENMVTKLCSIVIVALFQFILNRAISFGVVFKD